MRALLLRLEPIIWLLFGPGILIGTMLLTGWILVVGLLIPMGFVDASALSHERAHGLATSWLLGVLPRWLRDGCYDFVAKRRLRWFRPPDDVCPMIPTQMRARFSDIGVQDPSRD